MIQNVYYFLCGYLYVIFSGNNVRRFLNLCMQNDIILWEIVKISDRQFSCKMLWKDIYRIVPHLRKTKTKVKIVSKNGFPSQRIRYRKRYVWLFSILSLVFICYILSGRIWKIDIYGNSYLSDEEMLRFLKRNHATYNSKKADIDCAALELELRKQLDEVICASVYMEGTKLVVEIQESIQTQQMKTALNEANDIVAAKDAVIASIITRAGVPKVVKGNSVKKGEILVQSAYPIVNDDETVNQYLTMCADADVKGYVTYTYEDTLPVSEIIKEKTGNKYNSYSFQIGNTKIQCPTFKAAYEDSQVISKVKQIHILDDFYLPVFTIKEEHMELKEKTKNYSKNVAKKILSQKFFDFLEELEENGVLIISKNVIMEKKGEIYYMHGTIQTCEEIGKKVPAEEQFLDISQEDTKHQ